MDKEQKPTLEEIDILKCLHEWDKGTWWYGYPNLQQEVLEESGTEYSINQLKKTMKNLRSKEYVYHSGSFDYDGLINGSGNYLTSKGREYMKTFYAY